MFVRDLELEDQLGGLFVQATQNGDKKAMERVMGYSLAALTDSVSRGCDTKGRSRGFIEIVAYVTMMKAFNAATEFDASKPLMAWLSGIAWNEFIDLYRVEKRLDERHESLDLKLQRPTHGKNAREEDNRDALRLVAGPDPLEELIRREDDARVDELRELLDAAIPSLPNLKRQVVELYRAEKSVGTIAVMLNLRPARVSKLLFDAKEELRRRIG